MKCVSVHDAAMSFLTCPKEIIDNGTNMYVFNRIFIQKKIEAT